MSGLSNPWTKPFEFLRLSGKLQLYARKDCTEQLRKLHGVSLKIVGRELVDGVYVVTSQATDRTGRTDESIGAVPVENWCHPVLLQRMLAARDQRPRS